MNAEAWPSLPKNCLKVLKNLKFYHPTKVQSRCLPAAIQGESMQVVAPTGTGKTLVYLLPIFNTLPANSRNLVLVPTRELGYQVSQMLQALDPTLRMGLALCVGGHEVHSQLRALQHGWHTLIATPGRLLDLLEREPELLHSIRLLVIDEFDKLIDLGFETQIGSILPKLPVQRQTLLFSATGEEDALNRLPLGSLKPYRLIAEGKSSLEEAFYFLKSNRKKNELLLECLQELKGQAIVFVSNREKANHLNGLLKLRGFASQALHGDRLQSERAKAYQGFREGRYKILVATDLAARGLDIPQVDLIVNHDLPRTFKDYVHRSGRTARRNRPGVCLSFAGPDEFLPLRNLEAGFNQSLPCHPNYAQRENWLRNAKKVHDSKVKDQERLQSIWKKQGIIKLTN